MARLVRILFIDHNAPRADRVSQGQIIYFDASLNDYRNNYLLLSFRSFNIFFALSSPSSHSS
jgi:hypothetical protein